MDYNAISITFTNMFIAIGLSFLFYMLLIASVFYVKGKDINDYSLILIGPMVIKETIVSFLFVIIFAFYLFMIMIDGYEPIEVREEKKKEYTINLNINHTFVGKNDTYKETFNH